MSTLGPNPPCSAPVWPSYGFSPCQAKRSSPENHSCSSDRRWEHFGLVPSTAQRLDDTCQWFDNGGGILP